MNENTVGCCTPVPECTKLADISKETNQALYSLENKVEALLRFVGGGNGGNTTGEKIEPTCLLDDAKDARGTAIRLNDKVIALMEMIGV